MRERLCSASQILKFTVDRDFIDSFNRQFPTIIAMRQSFIVFVTLPIASIEHTSLAKRRPTEAFTGHLCSKY